MNKKKGLMYCSGTLVILCTADSDRNSKRTFAGVVVKNWGSSGFPVGEYSISWTSSIFILWEEKVELDGSELMPYVELNTSPGP